MLDATVFYSQQATGKALNDIYISEFSKLLKIYDLVKLAREVKAPGRIVGLSIVNGRTIFNFKATSSDISIRF